MLLGVAACALVENAFEKKEAKTTVKTPPSFVTGAVLLTLLRPEVQIALRDIAALGVSADFFLPSFTTDHRRSL